MTFQDYINHLWRHGGPYKTEADKLRRLPGTTAAEKLAATDEPILRDAIRRADRAFTHSVALRADPSVDNPDLWRPLTAGGHQKRTFLP